MTEPWAFSSPCLRTSVHGYGQELSRERYDYLGAAWDCGDHLSQPLNFHGEETVPERESKFPKAAQHLALSGNQEAGEFQSETS